MNSTGASSSQRIGTLQMASAGLLLATVGVFVHEAGQGPWLAVWFRCVFGAVALGLFAAWGGERLRWPTSRQGWAAALAGGVLMTGNWVLFFKSLDYLPIGVSTLLFHIQPLMVLAWAGLVQGERVPRGKWVAAAVVLAGIAVVTFGAADASGPEGAPVLLGVVLCLAGAGCYTGVTLIARRSTASATSQALWQCAVGAVLLAWVPVVQGVPPPGTAWVWLVGLGVLHTGLAYLLMYRGMKRIGTAQVAILQFVYPVGAVLVDWVMYGRRLNAVQLVGLAVAIIALSAATRKADHHEIGLPVLSSAETGRAPAPIKCR